MLGKNWRILRDNRALGGVPLEEVDQQLIARRKAALVGTARYFRKTQRVGRRNARKLDHRRIERPLEGRLRDCLQGSAQIVEIRGGGSACGQSSRSSAHHRTELKSSSLLL